MAHMGNSVRTHNDKHSCQVLQQENRSTRINGFLARVRHQQAAHVQLRKIMREQTKKVVATAWTAHLY